MNTRKSENETVTFDEVTFERSKKKYSQTGAV